MVRLNVNIDHVATIRQARRAQEPSVVAAAVIADLAGADGITVHLRGDRRHIQDQDVRLLRGIIKTHLNVEMAATDEMIDIARDIRPDAVTLVPERAEEITTEGGLDVLSAAGVLRRAVKQLKSAEILTSIFVDPEPDQISEAAEIGAEQIEICTSKYSSLTEPGSRAGIGEIESELDRILDCSRIAEGARIQVAAGHGLTYRNVGRIAELDYIEELNIGHNIIARATFVGLERAVAEMIASIAGFPFGLK